MSSSWLRLTVLAPVATGVLFAAVLGFAYFTLESTGSDVVHESTTESGLAIHKLMARSLFDPLYQLDVRSLQTELDSMVGETSLTHAAVIDTDGRIVASSSDGWVPEPQIEEQLATRALLEADTQHEEIGEYLVVSGEIAVGSEQIGVLVIAQDTSAQRATFAAALRDVKTVLPAILVAAALLSVVGTILVVRPFGALARAAKNIERGDLRTTIKPAGLSEGKALGRAMEEMRRRLLANQESLEERVRERTAEFEAANLDLSAEIVERRRAEDALRQSRTDLEVHANELRFMNEHLTETSGALSRANDELSREVAGRRQAQDSFRESERIATALLNATSESALLVDLDGIILELNGVAEERLQTVAGLTKSGESVDLRGRCVYELFPPDLRARRKARNDQVIAERKSARFEDERDGTWFDNSLHPILDDEGNVAKIAIFSYDITALKQAEMALRRNLDSVRDRARRDPLTNLLNHGAIVSELDNLLSAGASSASGHYVAMVDVDGLKLINDTYGHLVGDALIVAVADAVDRGGAIAGRYGGDEFVVILPNTTYDEARRYQADVEEELNRARVRDPESGVGLRISASIGIASWHGGGGTVPALIEQADEAMYAAKRQRHESQSRSKPKAQDGLDIAATLALQIVPMLGSSAPLQDKLRLISHRIAQECRYDAMNIALFDTPGEKPLAMNSYFDDPNEASEKWVDNARSGRGQPFRSLLERTRRPIVLDDIANDSRLPEPMRRILLEAGLRSGVTAPILWQDQVIGSMAGGRKALAGFSSTDVKQLTAIADQVAAVIGFSVATEKHRRVIAESHEQSVFLLAEAAEAHDHATGRHLLNLRAIAEALAIEIGYGEDDARALGLAAILHDVGKLSVPAALLASPNPLTQQERTLMQQHADAGLRLLSGRAGFELAAAIAGSHHEWWNGGGYPKGDVADAIPEAATIVSVADAYDAITSGRPYRRPRSIAAAVREITSQSGTQFSPKIVAALARLHEQGKLRAGHSDPGGLASVA